MTITTPTIPTIERLYFEIAIKQDKIELLERRLAHLETTLKRLVQEAAPDSRPLEQRHEPF